MTTFTYEIDAIIQKINSNQKKYGSKFPHLSRSGHYSEALNEDGSWTGSFWTGMVTLAYMYTKDEKHIDYLCGYLPAYEWRLREGYKDHDLGFLYQLYAVVLYQAAGNAGARSLAIQAAEHLIERYNANGRFIRAWGPLDDSRLSGKMIIDCMMNLPLLFSVTEITGDSKYAEIAEYHADSTYKYNIRQDCSTYHTFDFDPETGDPIGGFNEGGFADESAWSRGQAWGIYGFALAYRHTGKAKFLEASRNLADYFLVNLPEDLVPYWDFKLPDNTCAWRDTSAAAIAACGMFEIAELSAQQEVRNRYKEAAVNMLLSLKTRYSAAEDKETEAILRQCYASRDNQFAIWGDYFYMEGLLRASGIQTNTWSLQAERTE